MPSLEENEELQVLAAVFNARWNLARKLLDEHGYHFIRIEVRLARKYLALAVQKGKERILRLNKYTMVTASEEEFTDTILHEIAHFMAGLHNGHNDVWKRACMSIGARPQKYYTGDKKVTPEKEWRSYCTACGKTCRWTHRKRSKIAEYRSGCCRAAVDQEKVQRN